MKTIGILGGMGPEASADLYLKLIERFYRQAGTDMGGYPHILINNLPVPNLFQQEGEAVGRYLGRQARILEEAGAQVMGIACNSAHFYLAPVREALSGCRLLDMIHEAALRAQAGGHTRVGVLSTIMSRNLYERHITELKLTPVLPDSTAQKAVEEIVSAVLSGDKSAHLTRELAGLGAALAAQGAQCVVLGCTDLPLILNADQVDYPLYSSTDVLADALCREARSD